MPAFYIGVFADKIDDGEIDRLRSEAVVRGLLCLEFFEEALVVLEALLLCLGSVYLQDGVLVVE